MQIPAPHYYHKEVAMEENINCIGIEFTDKELDQIMEYQRIIEADTIQEAIMDAIGSMLDLIDDAK